MQKIKRVIFVQRESTEMAKIDELKKHLQEGKVYRRAELALWSKAVDREINVLVKQGFLSKLSQGVYHVPKNTVFGCAPPDEEDLVRTFLKDDDFLITSWNVYNTLSVGTTQLYNKRIVYNHKRHGEFKLGNKLFFFHAKHCFPKKVTQEFLLVDLVNNLDNLAEDNDEIMKNVLKKASNMHSESLKSAILKYGGTRAKNSFSVLFPQVYTL